MTAAGGYLGNGAQQLFRHERFREQAARKDDIRTSRKGLLSSMIRIRAIPEMSTITGPARVARAGSQNGDRESPPGAANSINVRLALSCGR